MKLNIGAAALAMVCAMTSCKKANIAATKDETEAPVEPAATAESAPASTLEGEMSDAMKSFRDKFLACASDQDIADRLNEVTDALKAGKFDDPKQKDIKFVAAQLLPLLPLRGVIWRMVPIVENRKNRTVQSIGVTALMGMATATRIVGMNESAGMGTGAWRALSHYFNWPYKAKGDRPGVGPQYTSIHDLQDTLVPELWTAVNDSIKALEQLQVSDKAPIVWDNRILAGRNTFGPIDDKDNPDRFLVLGKPEVDLTIASFYATLHNLRTFVEYDLDALPAYVRSLGMLMGMEEFSRDPSGMSARDRVTALCSSAYPAKPCNSPLFVQRNGTAERDKKLKTMVEAHANLKKAVDLLAGAWNVAKDQNRKLEYPTYQLLDPIKLIGWDRMGSASIENIQKLVNGEPVRNAVTGEMVSINVPEFYRNPPKDMKAFLPIRFMTGAERVDMNGFKDVRNYEYGMSAFWRADVYGTYFPSVKVGGEVPDVLRSMSQTWGGWVAFMPLTAMSMVL